VHDRTRVSSVAFWLPPSLCRSFAALHSSRAHSCQRPSHA
jgi:hypothetical protein